MQPQQGYYRPANQGNTQIPQTPTTSRIVVRSSPRPQPCRRIALLHPLLFQIRGRVTRPVDATSEGKEEKEE